MPIPRQCGRRSHAAPYPVHRCLGRAMRPPTGSAGSTVAMEPPIFLMTAWPCSTATRHRVAAGRRFLWPTRSRERPTGGALRDTLGGTTRCRLMRRRRGEVRIEGAPSDAGGAVSASRAAHGAVHPLVALHGSLAAMEEIPLGGWGAPGQRAAVTRTVPLRWEPFGMLSRTTERWLTATISKCSRSGSPSPPAPCPSPYPV
jgi:hypothetical protein